MLSGIIENEMADDAIVSCPGQPSNLPSTFVDLESLNQPGRSA
jgi:hypothetical protein